MNAQRPSVLFLNRVYPPAGGATGQLLADLAPGLAGAGWRVTILTARPSRELPADQTVDGVRILRAAAWPAGLFQFFRGGVACNDFTGAAGASEQPGPARRRSSHWKRALGYLGMYPALFTGALRLARHDLVVTLTDPPLLGALGPMIKKLKRCRVVHWAQDLYPEVAEETGVIRRHGLGATFLRRLSTRALLDADRVVAVGRCMKDRLVQRGLSPESIDVIPNWAPKGVDIQAGAGPETFRSRHQLDDRFVVMYSGNLGLAHRFEAILEAADFLQARLPKALFLFVGDGSKLGWVQDQAARRRLCNVRFLPAQPRDSLAQTLAAADLHLASMRDDLLGLVVPSKVYGILAAGRPCVFLGPKQCEAARVILEHQCGSVGSAEDGRALADELLRWFFDLNGHQEAGQRALAASKHFHADLAVRRFGALFRALLDLSVASPRLESESGVRK